MRRIATSSVPAPIAERAINAKLPRLSGRDRNPQALVVQAIGQRPKQRHVLGRGHESAGLIEQFRGDARVDQKGLDRLAALAYAGQHAVHQGDRNRDRGTEHQEGRGRGLRSFAM